TALSASSYTRSAPARGDGDEVGWSCAQSVPSQLHVSLLSAPSFWSRANPPNRITRFMTGSKTAAAFSRSRGWWAGWSCVQRVPSHVHVSLRSPSLPLPPNRTSTWWTVSKASEAPTRAGGPAAADPRQWLPSQIQVSLSKPGAGGVGLGVAIGAVAQPDISSSPTIAPATNFILALFSARGHQGKPAADRQGD